MRTYDTGGEGERVSHWKMKRGGAGTKLGKERKQNTTEERRTSLFRFCEDAGNEVLLL